MLSWIAFDVPHAVLPLFKWSTYQKETAANILGRCFIKLIHITVLLPAHLQCSQNKGYVYRRSIFLLKKSI